MQPRKILGSASELATSRSVIHFYGLQALWAPAGSLGNWEAFGKGFHSFLATPLPRRTPFQHSERGEAAWNLGHGGEGGHLALQSVPFSSLAAPPSSSSEKTNP